MDDRRDDEPRADEAVFRVARVGQGRGARATAAALALTVAVGALVVSGTVDAPSEKAGGPGEALAPIATSMPGVQADRAGPVPTAVVARPASPILVLQARAWGRYVFVHGDVFTLDAEVVVVSIMDGGGEVIDIRSVELPKGSTALRIGANDRFQLAFEVGGVAAAQVALVEANAYDRFGRRIASERQLLDAAANA